MSSSYSNYELSERSKQIQTGVIVGGLALMKPGSPCPEMEFHDHYLQIYVIVTSPMIVLLLPPKAPVKLLISSPWACSRPGGFPACESSPPSPSLNLKSTSNNLNEGRSTEFHDVLLTDDSHLECYPGTKISDIENVQKWMVSTSLGTSSLDTLIVDIMSAALRCSEEESSGVSRTSQEEDIPDLCFVPELGDVLAEDSEEYSHVSREAD
ncbi:hypothetical protein J6590_012327 [Homalodisca vitripennis]|nr:hypothetical protein J6590_012327 [Homalodisca vitripennis]